MCQEDDEETGMLSIHLLLRAGDGAQAAKTAHLLAFRWPCT